MPSFGSSRGRGHGNNYAGSRPPSKQSSTTAAQPRLQLCRNFATGNCQHGDRCKFSHVLKALSSIEVSDKNKDAKQNFNNRGYNGGHNKVKENYKVSSVAVWETNGMIKLFTGSHDGKWRLYNAAPQAGGNVTLTKEFEHYLGGPVDAVHVASHYFFCGFEASPTEAPDAKAGMVHSWNLNAAQDPPMELCISPMAKYAGSGKIRSLWTTSDGGVWSGGSDGIIRQWKYDPTTKGFSFVRNLSGHLGAVTGLALMKGILWSGGMDGTLRLWNADSGDAAHLIPAQKKETANNGSSPPALGHSGPITGLLPFEVPNDGGTFVFSSSLDETVKVWNATNGECVASEKHGQGVTSIALTSDLKGNPLLLCGLFYGDIMIRGTVSNPPLVLLSKVSMQYLGAGHSIGPVNDIQPGPNNTFCAVADDGKLTLWQITGDFGL